MNRESLRKELQGMLGDASGKFPAPSDLDRLLGVAAADLSRVRPLVISAQLTLTADESACDAPEDMIRPLSFDWGAAVLAGLNPWNDQWPGRLPRLSVGTVSGTRKLLLSQAPTSFQISILGSTADYCYSARYAIGDTDGATTVPEHCREPLLIRALAEAMQELAVSGSAKPVTLGGTAGVSLPKNGTPQALSEALMTLFERMAA